MTRGRDVEFDDLLAEIIRTHPMPPPRTPVPCPACKTPTADGEACRTCREARWRQDALQKRLHVIPPRYRWADLKDALMGQRVRAWGPLRAALAGAPGRSLVLWGPAGAGKTSVMAAMVRAEVEADRDVCWVAARDLATTRAQNGLGEESALESRAKRCRLLALDDLGNDRRTQLSAIDDVLLERHDQELRTWVTTALGPAEVTARYGAGIARRVFEGALVIEVGRRDGA